MTMKKRTISGEADAESDTNSSSKDTFNNFQQNTKSVAKKRKLKSTRLSESESSSSWENKQFSNSNVDVMSNFGNSILLKTPERRLKMLIRVKRSPTSSNTCSSFDQNYSLGDKLSMNDDNEPEYEILRTEGIDCNAISETESTTSLIFSGVKRSKRKKRHKHKRKRNKNKFIDSNEFNFDQDSNLEESSSFNEDGNDHCKIQSNFTTTKRVKLMFGNEIKILNIPDKIETSNEADSLLKTNSNLLPAKSILVTNVFN